MSVMLVGSSIITTMLIPPEAFKAEEKRGALAYVAHEHLGHTFADALRHQHGRDSLVRWRLGDGVDAQPRAEYLPRGMAPEWPGEPPARPHLHGHHVPGHDPLQRRHRAGGACRHRARADGIGGARGHARRAAQARQGWLGYLVLSLTPTPRSSTSSSARKA